MEEIYKCCDRIVANEAISKGTLLAVLKGMAQAKKRKRPDTHYDMFKGRASSMNSRARKKGANGEVSANELRELASKQQCCQMCGRKNYLVFDHIVSLYNGGSNTIDNLQVLCRMCNMEKGAK